VCLTNGVPENGFLILEDGTDSVSQNVGKELPLLTVQYPRTVQFSNVINFITC